VTEPVDAERHRGESERGGGGRWGRGAQEERQTGDEGEATTDECGNEETAGVHAGSFDAPGCKG
jgi:hypothetical protein